MRKEEPLDDVAHELEEVDFALVVGLVVEQLEQLRLPHLVVVNRGAELLEELRELVVVDVSERERERGELRDGGLRNRRKCGGGRGCR